MTVLIQSIVTFLSYCLISMTFTTTYVDAYLKCSLQIVVLRGVSAFAGTSILHVRIRTASDVVQHYSNILLITAQLVQ